MSVRSAHADYRYYTHCHAVGGGAHSCPSTGYTNSCTLYKGAIRDGDFQKNVNLHKRLYFFLNSVSLTGLQGALSRCHLLNGLELEAFWFLRLLVIQRNDSQFSSL